MSTIRHQIIEALKVRPMDTLELAALFQVSQREIEHHLTHIAKSAKKLGLKMAISISECQNCEYTFAGIERFNIPVCCPKCDGQKVTAPFFELQTI